MGVKGLWRLLMPIGRRISIETLEGKILAVDASIWLTQFITAMKDPESGKVRPAAHLIGFIRRLCKLRYQGIRPVFVFDGATPEIKLREVRERRRRRDQFRSDGGSVQRTAKRLLLQQLKKQKQGGRGGGGGDHDAAVENSSDTAATTFNGEPQHRTAATTGASAPDFYDPEMENGESCSNGTKKKEDNTIVMDTEVLDLLEEGQEDYLDKATARVSAQSDWDVEAVDEEQSEDAVTQTDGQGSSQPKDIRDYTSTEQNDFDADYVASLPSIRRKDLVEDAQRKRRLQSRREFMKVAYDPEGLSKCQLRNFLKSTKLNQNIHKMAQQASKADGWGDTRGPNRKRRIIFETNSDVAAKKKETKEQTLRKFRQVRKLSVLSSSEDESDEDIEWQDINDKNSGRAGKPTAILDDDDSDNDESDNDDYNDTLRNGAGFKSCEGFAKMPSHLATNDDDSDSGPKAKKLCILALGSTERLPVSSSTSGYNKMSIVHGDELSDDERKKPAQTRSEATNYTPGPEFNDEAIARALQEAEYSSDEDVGGGFLANTSESVTGLPGTPRPSEQLAEDTENDDISWEDGEGEGHIAVEPDVTWDSSHVVQISSENRINHVQSKALLNDGLIEHIKQTTPVLPVASASPCDPTIVAASGQTDDCGDVESVEWEDGDNTEDCSTGETLKQNKLIASTFSTYLDASSGDGIDDDNIVIIDEAKDDIMTANEDVWVDHSRIDNKSKSEEMTAALKQAQTTAANLTNWAGRAFRRAVAQHAEENGLNIPESAIPISLPIKSSHQVSPLSVRHEVNIRNIKQTEIIKPSRTPKKSGLEKMSEGNSSSSMAWPERTRESDAVLDTLEAYQEKWTEERIQEDGDMDTVTDEMLSETMTLLQLFGVPYVEAPAEAEAQCVMLEKLGLVDGIVTEDSDAFVFGGRRVYKNIFDDQKYVEAYDCRDAEKEMNLTRDGLVALAMLLGGDYTEGVKGVGIVNGMEIVHAFDASADVNKALSRFREWLDGFDPFDSLIVPNCEAELTKERLFHRKHQSARTRWDAPKSFPSPQVMNAYLNPVVETSEERFSWGAPDMDRLILFLNKHAGWSSAETRKLIQPVADKIASGRAMHQTRIESFMRYEDSIRFADIRSKRLRDVLSKAKTEPSGQALQNVEQLKTADIADESSKRNDPD